MPEGSEWERWFQFSSGVFSLYLLTYNNTYGRVQEDLQGLSELEREALKCVLMRDGEVSSASVESYCGFEPGAGGPKRLVDRLLRMGIVIQGQSGTLLIVSRVMRQIIVEALPVRVITQVATTDDPMLLLKTALRNVRPKAISYVLVSNCEAPSESAFHFEIYAAMRDIVKKAKATGRGVLAEVKTPGDKERADIIIANGIKLGYELKVNQLSVSGITSAVAQADRYRLRFDIHHMLVVNFVPKGHVLDEIYHVEAYPGVQVVHVRYDVSCDDYQVCYQRTNGLPVVKEICEPCPAS